MSDGGRAVLSHSLHGLAATEFLRGVAASLRGFGRPVMSQ